MLAVRCKQDRNVLSANAWEPYQYFDHLFLFEMDHMAKRGGYQNVVLPCSEKLSSRLAPKARKHVPELQISRR